MEGQYNARSPAVKRLMREAKELKDPTTDYFAQPLSDNLFEWHFTVRGPADTEFDGGIYHGRIILPTDYPMKPPNIIVLTPNGRFETGKKICLSISGHHPESWQPSWSIRTALLAIIGFMPTPGQGTIGSLDYSKDERKMLARKSKNFQCEECCPSLEPVASRLLKPSTRDEEASSKLIKEAEEIARQMAFKGEGEDHKPSAHHASSGDGSVTNNSQNPSEEETEDVKAVRLRKEASKIMQNKFREKLVARTRGMINQIKKSSARNSPAASASGSVDNQSGGSPALDSARRLQGRESRNRSPLMEKRNYLIEVLVALIVVVIAAVFYRRSGTLLNYLYGPEEADAAFAENDDANLFFG